MTTGTESMREQPANATRPRRIRPVQTLPTLVTLGNLISGLVAMMKTMAAMAATDPVTRAGLEAEAAWLIFLAMIFDAVDGKVARLTGQTSRFGEQVDSICDVVSFGAAPALLFHEMMISAALLPPRLSVVLAGVYVCGGALRLARFNSETTPDEESHRWFKGLPIPAAAAVVASWVILNRDISEVGDSWVKPLMPWLMGALGVLMVSRLRYMHLAVWLFKRKTFTMLIFLVGLFALIATQYEVMVPLICTLFMLSGPIMALLPRRAAATGSPA